MTVRGGMAIDPNLADKPNVTLRHAFTLLELLVVLILIALLAGIAVVSVMPTLRRARFSSLVTRIIEADRQERSLTLRQPFDGMLSVSGAGQTLFFHLSNRTVHCPAGWRVIELRQSRGATVGGGSRRRGRSNVSYNADGQSPTYAIGLQQKNSGATNWLIFLGITGQSVRTDNTRIVDTLVGD